MLPVYQAFDRVQFAEVATDGAEDLEGKLARASEIFAARDGWLKPHQRVAVLQDLAKRLDVERERFTRLIAREGGKPYTDAAIEVARAIDGVRDGADELRNFGGREIPMAIATGCPVIVKPANTTPLCCLEFVKLVHAAGLPEALCQSFVPPDNVLAERLALDQRVAFLSFIGSARVGWALRSKLPPGTRCALEHGGSAPVIVDRDVDIEAVVSPIVKGGYYHAGQVCVSVQRIFVHADVYDGFVDELSTRVAKLRVGDPLLPETDVGPLILPKEVERVASWVDEATRAGARVAVGGRALSQTTYQPTVLLEPPPTARVTCEEVFGPVTCVYRFAELDDALERANGLPLAFQASVFTNRLDVALRAAERLDAATVLINDHTAFRSDWMQSGYGIG